MNKICRSQGLHSKLSKCHHKFSNNFIRLFYFPKFSAIFFFISKSVDKKKNYEKIINEKYACLILVFLEHIKFELWISVTSLANRIEFCLQRSIFAPNISVSICNFFWRNYIFLGKFFCIYRYSHKMSLRIFVFVLYTYVNVAINKLPSEKLSINSFHHL